MILPRPISIRHGINRINHRLRLQLINHTRVKSTTINITPGSTPTTVEPIVPVQQEFKSITTSLSSYVHQFPKEMGIINKIDLYKDIKSKEYAIQTIKIGVFYNDHNKKSRSKVIDTLLADPLAKNNQEWYDKVKERKVDKVNVFKFDDSKFEIKEDPNQDVYVLPSPVLSAELRQSFNVESVKNNIEIVEYPSIPPNDDEVHYYVLVTPDLSTTLNLFPHQDKLLITIVDNTEYTPSSTESTKVTISPGEISSHVVKINSQLLYDGIENFLIYDTKGASTYLDSIKHSNIYELMKVLERFNDSKQLLNWILNDIVKDINSTLVDPDELVRIRDESVQDVNKFGSFVHNELQNEFKPNVERLFKSKLSWWKLYLKNDNIEYEIKDFFLKSFMTKSIEQYNYIHGKVDSKYNHTIQTELTSNPLQTLKNDIINERITKEIQPVVYKSIVSSLTLQQIPISIIGFLSYYYFEFSVNSAVAIVLLGLIVGFNNVSKTWVKFSNNWLNELFEEIRLCISQQCIENGLSKRINQNFSHELNQSQIKRDILQDIINLQNKK
ncbi:hypothetical protein DFJ63DRAFT_215135 [Scheffersomyces coipomensis]|uniref:uncharacterized protein n=1 Tax=Scheffersomyces coipomensis TaxID=1788519 RepID=UPI00315C5143